MRRSTDDTWVELERCVSCERDHPHCSLHKERKYDDFSERVQSAILAAGVDCKFEVNPGPKVEDYPRLCAPRGTRLQEMAHCRGRCKMYCPIRPVKDDNGIPSFPTVRYPRLGAFEVYVNCSGRRLKVFSKIDRELNPRGFWPDPEEVADQVRQVVESGGSEPSQRRRDAASKSPGRRPRSAPRTSSARPSSAKHMQASAMEVLQGAKLQNKTKANHTPSPSEEASRTCTTAVLCSCGWAFPDDLFFCGKCGMKRPDVPQISKVPYDEAIGDPYVLNHQSALSTNASTTDLRSEVSRPSSALQRPWSAVSLGLSTVAPNEQHTQAIMTETALQGSMHPSASEQTLPSTGQVSNETENAFPACSPLNNEGLGKSPERNSARHVIDEHGSGFEESFEESAVQDRIAEAGLGKNPERTPARHVIDEHGSDFEESFEESAVQERKAEAGLAINPERNSAVDVVDENGSGFEATFEESDAHERDAEAAGLSMHSPPEQRVQLIETVPDRTQPCLGEQALRPPEQGHKEAESAIPVCATSGEQTLGLAEQASNRTEGASPACQLSGGSANRHFVGSLKDGNDSDFEESFEDSGVQDEDKNESQKEDKTKADEKKDDKQEVIKTNDEVAASALDVRALEVDTHGPTLLASPDEPAQAAEESYSGFERESDTRDLVQATTTDAVRDATSLGSAEASYSGFEPDASSGLTRAPAEPHLLEPGGTTVQAKPVAPAPAETTTPVPTEPSQILAPSSPPPSTAQHSLSIPGHLRGERSFDVDTYDQEGFEESDFEGSVEV